jgi:hypothetical protein
MKKDELLKRLHSHPLFKSALRSVDPEQGKKIAALTEGFLSRALDGLVPLIHIASSDPSQAREAATVLTNVSGSKGS